MIDEEGILLGFYLEYKVNKREKRTYRYSCSRHPNNPGIEGDLMLVNRITRWQVLVYSMIFDRCKDVLDVEIH